MALGSGGSQTAPAVNPFGFVSRGEAPCVKRPDSLRAALASGSSRRRGSRAGAEALRPQPDIALRRQSPEALLPTFRIEPHEGEESRAH
jgi:hypothetical protein